MHETLQNETENSTTRIKRLEVSLLEESQKVDEKRKGKV